MPSLFYALVCYDWKCLGVGLALKCPQWSPDDRLRSLGNWSVCQLPTVSSGRWHFALWNPGQPFDWKPKWSTLRFEFLKPFWALEAYLPSHPVGGGCRSRLSRVYGPEALLVNPFKACFFLFPDFVALDSWVISLNSCPQLYICSWH